MTEELGGVVEFRRRDDAPVRRRPRRRFCAHWRTELDGGARRVYCRDCGEEVPAFDVLQQLAAHFEAYESSCKRARADAERAAAELAEVKRELRNAKARLRRATR